MTSADPNNAALNLDKQALASEERLLALINELQAFEREFQLGKRFNVFEAIDMVRKEIKHSRFLAYLLDPNESHGLGDRFLRGLLQLTAKRLATAAVSLLELGTINCSDALVYCERDHFDILIQIPEHRLIFVIENKVDSSERPNQLPDYRESIESRYENYRFMGLFLTPDGVRGEDDSWAALGYGDIADELKALLVGADVSADTSMAIRHYIELIERHIVVPQGVIDACRRIYKAHRAALDLIAEHGDVSTLAEAFKLFNVKQPSLHSFATRSYNVDFLVRDWLDIAGFQIADPLWRTSFPVKFWFHIEPRRLTLHLEVGPFLADSDVDRSEFIRRLRSRFTSPATSKPSGVFTKVVKRSRAIPEDATAEETATMMGELWTAIGERAATEVSALAAECLHSRLTPFGGSSEEPQVNG